MLAIAGFIAFAVTASSPPLPPDATHRDVDGSSEHRLLLCEPAPFRAVIATGGLSDDPVASFLTLDTDPEGDMPRAVAITPDGQFAVVVNRDTDLMVFVDLATVQIVASVTVGDYPVDVAISGDGQYALSANVFGNSVSVVDIATKSWIKDIPVTGTQPFLVRATEDGSRAVVGVVNDAVNSALSVLDLGTLTEERSIPSTPQGVIGFFFTPAFAISGELFTTFALSPDGTTIILPWRGGATVTLYDVDSGRTKASLATANAPAIVDVAADGSIAAVVHDGSPSHVTVIDLSTNDITASHSIGTSLDPFIARLTPNKQHVMAAISNNVVFINLATGATDSTVSTGSVGDIEISSDGLYAFVSNFNAAIINLATRTLVATIPFGACVDAATSAVGNLAVALNNRFREEIYVYTISGPSSSFKGFTLSGPAPEADAPKEISISPDGLTALVSNAVSRNVSFVDIASKTVIATVNTGDVPRESAFTPDGAYALVCNGDSNTTSIIDVATKQVVKTLATTQRPTRVRVAPNGSEAYVCTIAGTDSLYVIELDGANSAITHTMPIGQMGAIGAYTYGEVSSMELSPDGSLLAFAISFDDIVRIVDTATHEIIADVPVGDFPIRAIFSPDSTEIYVACSFTNEVSVVRNDGGWFLAFSVAPIPSPLDMALDSDGTHLYVTQCGSPPAVAVIDLAKGANVQTIPLSAAPREGEYIADRDEFFATTNDATVVRIDADGPSSSIVQTIPIAGSPPDMRYSAQLKTLVLSEPFLPDGLDIVSLDPQTVLGDLDGDGDVDASDLAILLGAWGSRGGPADLDKSGSVGAPDLAILLGAWG
ncbi:MAG: cytochrome D1 domain-containing protein [Phycisphaerae bacterium]|nr:cytochrome D1 domain-containing protein [Phycisphaerae bacterium]